VQRTAAGWLLAVAAFGFLCALSYDQELRSELLDRGGRAGCELDPLSGTGGLAIGAWKLHLDTPPMPPGRELCVTRVPVTLRT
jgi:hypothetical protein